MVNREHRSFTGRPMRAGVIFLLLLPIVCLDCLGPVAGLYPPAEGEPTYTVYVINQGWHTGLVFRTAFVDTAIWPAAAAFAGSEYIEVGWGDAAFYQAEENSIWLGTKALFWPTPTVLHVAGFSTPVEAFFAGYRIESVQFSDSGFHRLCEFIQKSYALDSSGQVIPLGRGLYGDSQFYKANGHYFLTNTCNTWIAKAIRSGGYPITPAYGCTAGNVFSQIEDN